MEIKFEVDSWRFYVWLRGQVREEFWEFFFIFFIRITEASKNLEDFERVNSYRQIIAEFLLVSRIISRANIHQI
jgi:hypothetical protein